MPAFDKRTKGEPFQVFTEEWNGFLEAYEDFKTRSSNTVGQSGNINTQNGVVFVKNESSQDVDAFGYLVVEDFVFNPIDPSDQARADDAFRNQMSVKANVYDENNPKHVDPTVVICLGPIGAGRVGLGKLTGSTQVRVNIENEKHNCFTVDHEKTILKSATGGPVSSVVKQANTGEGWAIGTINPKPITKQFKVIELAEADIIKCVEFTDGVEGKHEFKVAMPYIIRKTPFDGQERDGFSFVYDGFNKRTSTRIEDDEEELQIIIDDYVEGDIIYATRCVDGGLEVTDENGDPVEWLDLNVDGRYWAKDIEEDEEEA